MLSRTCGALAKQLSRPRGGAGQHARAAPALLPPQPRGFAGTPARVEVSGRETLDVQWQDGVRTQLHPNWLRERCQSDATVDASTLQPKMSPHDLPPNLLLETVQLRKDEDAVQIAFNDGHVSEFSLAQLRAEVEGFSEHALQVPAYSRPRPRLWSAKDYEMRVFQHDEVVESEAARLDFLEEILTRGQALVRGVPRVEGEVMRFGQRLSTLRDSHWGRVFNVRTKPDEAALREAWGAGAARDLAYTGKPIGFHTDNPYRFSAPDYQLLHAIDHCTCPGGEAPCEECSVMNYMVDGFYVAEKLRREDPEAFELLCTVQVRFENNGGDNSSALVHVAPHFELEDDPRSPHGNRLRTIRFSGKSGQYAPPLPPAELGAFYRARRRFSELLHSPEDTMSLQLHPGDLLIFDNQRVLHARSGIAPTDGERWLQGAYLDRDGLLLNYERYRRRAGRA